MSRIESARKALGRELRHLREVRGVSGRTLAGTTGLAQSKISRVETGRLTPTIDYVERLLDALNATKEERGHLLRMAQDVSNDAVNWRHLLRRGLVGGQERIRQVEASTRLLRRFQVGLIPGLLQTEEYARAVMGTMPLSDFDDFDAAIAARMHRQELLYRKDKEFVFLLWEACLLSQVAEPDVLQRQLLWIDHICNSRSNVRVGVVPFGARLKQAPYHAFAIFDDQLVEIEFHTDIINLQIPGDVAYYIRVFDSFEEVAIFGQPVSNLLRQYAADYARAHPPAANDF